MDGLRRPAPMTSEFLDVTRRPGWSLGGADKQPPPRGEH
jgi:hypothetical protein